MKPLRTLLVAALLTPAVSALAAADLKTLATDAVENTFAGQNYSWTSTLPRPDGSAVTATGHFDRGTIRVVLKESSFTRTMLAVLGPEVRADGDGLETSGLSTLARRCRVD